LLLLLLLLLPQFSSSPSPWLLKDVTTCVSLTLFRLKVVLLRA
jgi:hypothetical protein